MKLFYPLLLSLSILLCSCKPSAKEGFEVVVRFAADPESVNPVNYGSANALQIVNLLYQSLLTVDLADNRQKPLLVSGLPDVTQNDSLSFITYELREEAAWDNGQPVTPYDVALSLKIIKSPLVNNDIIRPRYDFIRGLIPDSANTRRFTLVCRGYTEEMEFLTGDFMVLPAYLLDPDSLLHPFSLQELSTPSDALKQDARIKAYAAYFNSERFTRNKEFLRGSGGYALDDWKTGQYITLTRKPGWWGDKLSRPLPYLTAVPPRISFQIIPDNNSAVLALRNGQLDVFAGIPATEFITLQANEAFREQYTLYTPETYEFSLVGINGRLAKFADRRTRQALAYLIDVDNIIRATQANFAVKTAGPINPADMRYYNARIPLYQADTAKAADLLAEAGWLRQNGQWQKQINGTLVPLTLTLNYRAGNSVFEHTGLIFQQTAAAIGIPVTLQPLEGALLITKLKNHEFEAFLSSVYGNPFVFDFSGILHTESAVVNGANFTGFGIAESDSLIEAINRTHDESGKAPLLKRLQEILHEESNIIFLYFKKNRIAVHNRFTNIKISGIKPGYDVSAFALKTR